MPFQCSRDDPRLRDRCPMAVEVTLSSADARTLNPRKLLIRCQLSVWASAYEEETQEIAADAAGPALEKRLAPRKLWRIPEVREKTFTFSDVLRAPASKPEMEELLSTRVELGASDAKFIGKKLVLKGELELTALYLSGEQIASARFQLPYSQIIDMGEVPEDAEPEVVTTLKSADCRLTGGELEISVEALVQAAMWTCQPVTVLEDAFGLGTCVEAERAPVTLCTLSERTARREMGRKLCESGVSARQVLDCSAAVSSVLSTPVEGGVEYTAQVEATVLYLSEDDALCAEPVTIPVAGRVELPKGAECVCRCGMAGELMAVPVTGGIEVRCEVEFVSCVTGAEQIWAVSGLREGTAPADVRRPSVVIRRMGERETLWDVAKACGSAMADIQAVNGLAGQEGAEGVLLLIPAGR